MSKDSGFKKCCAEEIKRLWENHGGPMGIIHYVDKCPACNHFIGLTQTSEDRAKEFLSQYDLKL